MFGLFLQHLLGKFLLLALHLEAGSFPQPLSRRQEEEAFQALAAGDPAARDTLIRHNLRLVVHIAKKYRTSPDQLDDLVSIGTIGLMKAVSSFKPERGSRFSTYASRCIENEIKMYFRRCGKEGPTVSLQEPIEGSREGSDLTVADLIADEFVLEDATEHQEELARLRQMVARLDPLYRQVLELRYGLTGKPPMTQQDTAARLGISRSYVSRLEKRAIGLLKKKWR